MPGKLFIVARGDVATFESLRRSVGHEHDVTIIYDRRSDVWTDPSLARFWAHLRRRRNSRPAMPREQRTAERRRRDEVAEEIRRQGWAVVRRDQDPPSPRILPGAASESPVPPGRLPQAPPPPRRRDAIQPEGPRAPRRPEPRSEPVIPPATGDVDLPIARDIINRVMVGIVGVMLVLLAIACVVVLLLF